MAQLIATPASSCTQLADRGFYVVRVDNRDAGRWQRFVDRRYSLHDIATQAWARGVDTGGFERQLRAMGRTPDWSVKLLGIDVPVTIIYGDADPVIPVSSAHVLNRVIRRSHLEIVEGMGTSSQSS